MKLETKNRIWNESQQPVKLTLPGKTDHDQAASNFLMALDTAKAKALREGLTGSQIAGALKGRHDQVRRDIERHTTEELTN